MLAELDLRENARIHAPSLPDRPGLARAAQATWLGRMVNEHGSAAVFEALGEQLREAGAAESLVAECAAMAEEERRHGVLCGAVVEALGGEARAWVPAPAALPAPAGVGRLEAARRTVRSVCCLAETVAVSIISAERLEMPPGELRELLTRILADEIGHARFGWRWLGEVAPSLDAAARERLADYLEVAFAHLERHQLEQLPDHGAPPPEAVALGVCDGGEARAMFYATISDVIVPRLEAHGIPAGRAWSRRGEVELAG